MVWVLYLIAVSVVAFIGAVLWRAKNPPGVAYVAFVAAGAVLLAMAVIDTNWYTRVPAFMAGGQIYAILNNLKGSVEKIQAGVDKIEARLAIPMEEHGEGHETVNITVITPAPLPTATPQEHLP